MSKSSFIISWVAIILLIGFVVAYHNNYTIMLRLSHLDGRNYTVDTVYVGENVAGRLYRVILSTNPQGESALAILEKNEMGWWHVYHEVREDERPSEDGLLTILWVGSIDVNSFERLEITSRNIKTHLVYHGRNATGMADIPRELLPHGVILRTWQRGSEFILHFTAVSSDVDSFPLSDLDVMHLLGGGLSKRVNSPHEITSFVGAVL